MTKDELIYAIKECDRYIYIKQNKLNQRNMELEEIENLKYKMNSIMENFDLKTKGNLSNLLNVMSIGNLPNFMIGFCDDMNNTLTGVIYKDAVDYLEEGWQRITKKEKIISVAIDEIKNDILHKKNEKIELQYELDSLEV